MSRATTIKWGSLWGTLSMHSGGTQVSLGETIPNEDTGVGLELS